MSNESNRHHETVEEHGADLKAVTLSTGRRLEPGTGKAARA